MISSTLAITLTIQRDRKPTAWKQRTGGVNVKLLANAIRIGE